MLAVFGVGGFALQILDMIERFAEQGNRVCFVDEFKEGVFYGFPLIAPAAIPADADAIVAISHPATRRKVVRHLKRFGSLIAESARVHRETEIDPGAIICHQAIVEPEVVIGRHFQANIYSYVAHECRIGDYVTFAPRVSCNGRVVIGSGSYVGTGAFLKQGVRIGENAVIGMGSVVLNDVADGAVVVGNPAKRIR